MALPNGTRLGPYEILSSIGAGAMGEVYRARDARLNRDVALKVLPASFAADEDRARRFKLEAQSAGALNHPNILAIHDIGAHDGTPYIVSELLDGESLRARLSGGKLSVAKAVDYARQIASGLAAAHARGITHRDIKPENLFVTKDGRIKILDFGLAKVTQTPGAAEATQSLETTPGAVLGTAAYMSPEQVRGQAADHRSDIFSFGCVLYEMLGGRRAFIGESSVETMSAILKEEPPELSTLDPGLSPALDRITRHCLEKSPEARFQSAHDISFALESLSQTSQAPQSSGGAKALVNPRSRARTWTKWVLAATILVALIGGLYLGRQSAKPRQTNYQRLTFRRGYVSSARFAPDGNTVVYSAQWEDETPELFSVRMDSPESRPLGFPGATLLGLSRSSDLALSLNPSLVTNPFAPAGMLATAPFSGGSPRPLGDKIDFADWSPDGSQLAVVRETNQGTLLEFPVGKVLYKTAGYISSPRISPDGERIAFLDHSLSSNNGGSVAVIDKAGTKRTLARDFLAEDGLAWSSGGDEIWFTAARTGARYNLWAVNLSGRLRLIHSQSSSMVLQDISRDGRVLISNLDARSKLIVRRAGDSRERDLSWLDWTLPTDISSDGKLVSFSESGEGAGAATICYVRETSGAPAIKLGPGGSPALSQDGQSVITPDMSFSNILIYPIGPGVPRTIAMSGFTIDSAGRLPQGNGIWFSGSEPSHGGRFYLTDLDGAKPRPVTAEGVTAAYPAVTPDGQFFVGNSGGKYRLYPIAGGEPQDLPGFLEGERIAAWSKDGESLFAYKRSEIPAKVYRVDRKSGRRQFEMEIAPSDHAGIFGGGIVIYMTPDGKTYAYSILQVLSDLHMVEGLK